MNIEQALRTLAQRGASGLFSQSHGQIDLEVQAGEREIWKRSIRASACELAHLSVLACQLVSIVQQMERSRILGNVHRRFFELISSTDLEKSVTLKDLVNLASIVDEELASVEKSIGVKWQDGRRLVDVYGQTETKG